MPITNIMLYKRKNWDLHAKKKPFQYPAKFRTDINVKLAIILLKNGSNVFSAVYTGSRQRYYHYSIYYRNFTTKPNYSANNMK